MLRNIVRRQALIIICTAIGGLVAAPAQAADELATVFARIDEAAKTFKGVSADLVKVEHVAIVDDDTTQAGSIRLQRRSPTQTTFLLDLKDPGATTLTFNGKEAKIFHPKINTVEVWEFVDSQGLANQYLLLGFGATSAELKANYDISFAGDETIDGQATSHIKLMPKSAETRKHLKQAELWIGTGGVVVRQKLIQPAGDYKLVTYSNMKLRPVADNELQLKLPKGVVVQKMEK
jgi:outer membrane lipoprotein-sorting protein